VVIGSCRGRGGFTGSGWGGIGSVQEYERYGHDVALGKSNADHAPLHMRLKARLMQDRTPSKLATCERSLGCSPRYTSTEWNSVTSPDLLVITNPVNHQTVGADVLLIFVTFTTLT
jgi:hypothetical protein